MQPRTRNRSEFLAALLLIVALLAAAGPGQALAQTEATVAFDLYAMTGTLTLPGPVSVAVWGYSSSGTPGSATVPGPVLVVTQGDTVNVTLHNGLSVSTSLHLQGQALVPDLAGVAPGQQKTYTFFADTPGIFLYSAGPVPGAEYQVPMGLYGALIVRPTGAPSQAYANPETAFDVEAPLVLSEIDPALNNAADPAAFDLRNYKARYWLINGLAYPQTVPISALKGQKVLLRYVNAGLDHHEMAVLGLVQRFFSLDGVELPFYRSLTSEIIDPGQSADALVTLPLAKQAEGGTPDDIQAPPTRYPLYEPSGLLHNNGAKDANGMPLFGGMMTFIESTDLDPGVPVGPITTNPALTPNPTNGSVVVIVAATVSDVGRGGQNIAGARFFIDATTNPPYSMVAADGSFNSPTEAVQGAITIAMMAGLPSGLHPIYIQGQDSANNWGSVNHIVLNLDKTGPTTRAILLTPGSSRGNVDVAIQATGDDTATGGSNISAAEYRIDGGAASALTVSPAAPVASLNGTIPAATMGTLAEGAHTLEIRSQDALGNWGAWTSAILAVDKTGPATSGVSIFPNPNNGQQGVNPITPSVRVNATLDDPLSGGGGGVNSTIAAAEGFIDTLGADGTGFPFTPLDGRFDFTNEQAYAFIPLSTINLLPEGPHPIYVHGKDAAGNWGTAVFENLIIDKTIPTVSNVAANPNPTNGAPTFDLTATGTDSATNIAAGEWFEGADPGAGLGQPMGAADGAFNSPTEVIKATLNSSSFAPGNHTLYVRAKDAAGNWSQTGSVVVKVIPDLIFADGFESGSFSAWSSTSGTTISVTTAAKRSGTYGMQATINGTATGYVIDGRPTAEPTYHARFYFNPNNSNPGTGTPTIFVARTAANATVLQVQYRLNAGNRQVRAVVQRAGGSTATNWVTIGATAFTRVEVSWASGGAASFTLYVGGASQTLTNLNTSAFTVDTAVLGPSAGLVAGSTGTVYFDDFESRRFTVIGP